MGYGPDGNLRHGLPAPRFFFADIIRMVMEFVGAGVFYWKPGVESLSEVRNCPVGNN